ncbi:u1 small nuclear ribonucleoprotein A [Trichonephila inaurata madagascariensis]|uniref:U1 small nuclear ribonucleoprotein A n=1 Tax=Trichonephila inaurata madagascariensis TaxID=2747483 RepID=A0A8X7BW37_9ARAC|nr:u1 small nuclear ribonucleoprotein A [Trichonephila inaurata madagascariensis]
MLDTGNQIEPNNTIYINNLNEKIKEDELKKSLSAVFSQFGAILDIVAMKTLRMRGQAFVVFDDIKSAANALSTMQSFPFYDKPMRIQFAKTDSDIIAKRNGTYVKRIKEPRQELGDKKKKKAAKDPFKVPEQIPQQPGLLPGVPPGAMVQSLVPNIFSAHHGIPPAMLQVPHNSQARNHILFMSNLPKEANEQMLTRLFKEYHGFKEVRLIPSRHDIAFVEFDNEKNAAMAKENLDGLIIMPGCPLSISYANK